MSHLVSQDQITTAISKVGVWAPLLYILMQITGQVFAPLSTSVLFVAGFVMFGRVAIVYIVIVWMVSSVINFSLSRNYGKKVLKFFLGDSGILEVEKIVKRLNNKHLYLLRLLTFFSNDFASYAFGLTNMSFLNFLFATILSIFPWAIIMFSITRGTDSILMTTIKVFVVMIPFAILSYFFFKGKKKKI